MDGQWPERNHDEGVGKPRFGNWLDVGGEVEG